MGSHRSVSWLPSSQRKNSRMHDHNKVLLSTESGSAPKLKSQNFHKGIKHVMRGKTSEVLTTNESKQNWKEKRNRGGNVKTEEKARGLGKKSSRDKARRDLGTAFGTRQESDRAQGGLTAKAFSF